VSLVLLSGLVLGAGVARADRVDDLVRILEAPSSSYKVRLLTIAFLGRFQDKRAVPVLRRMVDRRGRAQRRLAITALGQIGDPSAIATLQEISRTDRNQLGALARRAMVIRQHKERPAAPRRPRAYLAAGRFTNHARRGGAELGTLLGRSLLRSFAKHRTVAVETEGIPLLHPAAPPGGARTGIPLLHPAAPPGGARTGIPLLHPAAPPGGARTGIALAAVSARPTGLPSYVVDGSIIRLDQVQSGERQRLTCHIRVTVATYPESSMKAFYRGEATVEAPVRHPVAELYREVIEGAAQEASQRILQSHLFRKQRPAL